MAGSNLLDLETLRLGCAQCSLRDLCLPAGITGSDLRQLDAIVRRRRKVAAGARLFHAGDTLENLFVARSGAFKSVALSADGEQQVLAFHLPGELIGLDGLGSFSHQCESVALTAADVCEVPFQQLTRIAAEIPGLQRQLLRIIGQSGGRDREHAGMLIRRHAHERIAGFLHALGQRMERLGDSSDRLRLPMTREEIASYLGMAFETVSRGFTRLQELGVIEVAGRRIRILQDPELRQLAHAPPAGEARSAAG